MTASWPNEPRVNVAVFRPGLALAVARVAPEPARHATLATAWLGGGEHDRNARFLVDHARADFLAGRAAAKSAVRALASEVPPPAQWEIRRGANHEPIIAHVAPRLGLSLAHAGGAGLALAHDLGVRCGLDLESLDRDAGDAIATQVTDAEAAWARAAGDRESERTRWLLLWTAREAQGKSFGTGLLDPTRLAATEQWAPAPHGGWRARIAGDASHRVRSIIASGFVISLVVPADADAEAMAGWLAAM